MIFSLKNIRAAAALILAIPLSFAALQASTAGKPSPSDEALVARFCGQILSDSALSISAIELSSDMTIIGPSLTILVSFTRKHPALTKTLLECMKILLTKSSEIRTPENHTIIKRMHTDALDRCWREYRPHCITESEARAITTALKNIGLYYSPIDHPLSPAILKEEASKQSQPQERTERNRMVLGVSVAVLAILALMTLSNNT